jgi:hypothetical protein
MSIDRCAIYLTGTMLLSACGTPETNARLGGVSPQDATALARLIHARTSARIISYTRNREGAIDVYTTDEFRVYVARRVGARWDIEEMGVVP